MKVHGTSFLFPFSFFLFHACPFFSRSLIHTHTHTHTRTHFLSPATYTRTKFFFRSLFLFCKYQSLPVTELIISKLRNLNTSVSSCTCKQTRLLVIVVCNKLTSGKARSDTKNQSPKSSTPRAQLDSIYESSDTFFDRKSRVYHAGRTDTHFFQRDDPITCIFWHISRRFALA